MELITYTFVDGNYARETYSRAMLSVFGEPGELNPAKIAGQTSAFKCFYYDCEDVKKDSESEEEFAKRLKSQQDFFSTIRSLPSVHVQLGKLTGGRRRRQKEVDVLLAVDMLTHGFHKNMTRAVLVSGDLDFRPVVEALLRLGVYVEVWYEKTSASEELYLAADRGHEMNWHMLYQWSSDSFAMVHSPPSRADRHGPVPAEAMLKAGVVDGRRKVILAINPDRRSYVIRFEASSGVIWYEHSNTGVLERYFCLMNGPISWHGG
jgi:uncharacterized LabA/DUF88 family protein